MNLRSFIRSTLGLTAALAVLGVASGPAAAATYYPSWCAPEAFSQPFFSFGDANWYTLAPGESADNLYGSGWTLSGGANVISTTLADGRTGSVLDLRAGSKAISPPMCVASGYPIARMIARNLAAAPAGVSFYVSTAGSSTLGKAMPVLGTSAWALSPPVNVVPGSVTGWVQVQFTFVAPANINEFQIYNFYVDPRMF
jgi:hypothetical protein